MRARWHWRRKSGRNGGNRAKRRRRNKQGVLGHNAARKTWLGSFPRSETFLNLCRTKIQDHLALGDVEDNGVTVSDSRDGAAIGRFGGNVSGHEAVRGARKSSGCEQSDRIPPACPDQRSRNRQHLSHSWTTLRAFITDNDYIPGLDGALLNGSERCFFVVEYARRAPKILQIVARHFNDAALRSEIPFQDDEPASGLERRIELADDFLRRRFFSLGCFFGEGASSDGDGVAAEQSSFKEALCYERGAACSVEIGSDKSSSGLEICDDRHAGTDAVKIINRKGNFRFVGDGQKMQHRVCRATGCSNAGDGILNRRFRDNFRGNEVTAKKFEHKLSRAVTGGCFSCICRRDAGESHGRNPQKFANQRHRVRGELSPAGASSRAGGHLKR